MDASSLKPLRALAFHQGIHSQRNFVYLFKAVKTAKFLRQVVLRSSPACFLCTVGGLFYHPLVSTSAIWRVFSGRPLCLIYPSRCIRQDRSVEIMYSAPVFNA